MGCEVYIPLSEILNLKMVFHEIGKAPGETPANWQAPVDHADEPGNTLRLDHHHIGRRQGTATIQGMSVRIELYEDFFEIHGVEFGAEHLIV